MTKTTTFVWNSVDDCIISELDGTGAVQATYTNEPQQYGGVLSQRRGTTTSTLHADALGTTRFLTDSSGNVTDTDLDDAWGNEVASSGTTVNPFRWVGSYGYYTDNSTGLVYVRARMYQPRTARWCSVDPLYRFPRAWAFKYSMNNPIVSVDPTGFISNQSSRSPCENLGRSEEEELRSCNINKSQCTCDGIVALFNSNWGPFTFAQISCVGERPTVTSRPVGLTPWIDRSREILRAVGAYHCVTEHEDHHIHQYDCLCPNICRGKQDGTFLTIDPLECKQRAECHAYAVQLDCMIREACKVLARIKSGKDEEARGILRVILQGIDLFGEAGANPRGACKNVQELRALTKNTANWEGMVLRNDNCNPREGVR